MASGPITGPQGPKATAPTGARAIARRGGAGQFNIPTDVAETHAAGETATVASVSLSSMLALQEVDSPTERDRSARRHAEYMLDELEGLQIELLGHPLDPERMSRLSSLVRSLPVATHPGLRVAVASVALRAGVEMARQDLRGVGSAAPGPSSAGHD